MSDIEPGQHEEIARRLRDEGLAQAPPDIAGEVMRRVRSEPRRSSSRVRRPLTSLLAAAVILAALVVGVAKLGGTGSGSASGGSVGETTARQGANSGAIPPKSAASPDSIVIRRVPLSALHGAAAINSLAPALAQTTTCLDTLHNESGITLSVPSDTFSSVLQQLRAARAAPLPVDTPRVLVRLRRAAANAGTAFEFTCP
jgi:hypothetical protein